VTITGTTASAQSLGYLEVQGCGSAAKGISLGPGPHVVQTQPGFPPGVNIDIDSLVLDSAPGGAALATTSSGRAQPTESGAAPTLTVVHSSTTSAQVVVHDPKGPFWMVLGQSTNAGWHATTGTGKDLGPPRVIDGYANGWLVVPDQPGHTMVITLDWTPQRLVGVALVASAATMVLCLALACWPRRRRRRSVSSEASMVMAGPAPHRASLPAALDDLAPTWGSPLRSSGTRPQAVTAVVVALIVGLCTSAVISPWAGLPVGIATLLALVLGYGRVVLAMGSVGLLVVVDRMVSAGQSKFRYLAEFGWPNHFETASTLAWFAVAALGADALVQEVRDRRARGAGGVARAGEEPSAPRPGDGDDAVVARPRRRRGKHVRRP